MTACDVVDITAQTGRWYYQRVYMGRLQSVGPFRDMEAARARRDGDASANITTGPIVWAGGPAPADTVAP